MSGQNRRKQPAPLEGDLASTYSCSIIIPTYNESDNIERIIEACREELSQYESDIIVVDDDSPDRTWNIVDKNYQDVDNITVIRRTDEKGLGSAIVRGFQESSKDICIVIDADLQHPPATVPNLLNAFSSEIDIVIGSRYLPRGGITDWSRRRYVISRGATLLSRLILPACRPLSDPLSGFFAVRREVVADLSDHTDGYKILVDILSSCQYNLVVEYPYQFQGRLEGDSNLGADEFKAFTKQITSLRIK